MKNLLKKFFFELKEWFADAADYYRLWILESKINSLNEELDFEFGAERHEMLILLDIYSEASNKITLRIRARESRHEHAVVTH